MTLDHETIELLRGSIRGLLAEESNRSFASRLDDLGWNEVVAADEGAALVALFSIKGEALSAVDALAPELLRLIVDRTGLDGSNTLLLPSPFGSVPGFVDGITQSTELGERVVAVVDGRLVVAPSRLLQVRELDATDSTLGHVRVCGDVGAADIEFLDPTVLPAVETRARWLLAAELVGIGRHVISSAVEYTGQRVQYGKPIGVFQALQHRLASAYSLVVGASHIVVEAAATNDAWIALVAKCIAGRAAETACTQAQQCYGAIGFTWEHEFHRYLRRTYLLDRMFGEWRDLEHEIGERLQATRVVPRIGSL